MYYPALNSTKLKIMQVTKYNLTLDPPLLKCSRAELHLQYHGASKFDTACWGLNQLPPSLL